MDRTKPISLWDLTSEEVEAECVSLPEVTVDVAIVGGGFTGLSTALHCAQKGLSAHVIEAKHIGFGGSGRNVGLVNAALWLPPAKVREMLGPTYGDRFLRRFSEGPSIVFDLIEKHQMRCEVTKTGTIHAAHGPAGLDDLKDRHAEWQRIGEPVDLLDAAEVSKMIGTKAFHGGLLDHRAGTINPMGYCRGLARAACAAGANITTGARATKLEQVGDAWLVKTSKGDLRAKAVVLGTNAYTDELWPGLKNVFTMIHYLQFATTPLGPDAAHILPGKQGVWDTGQIMFNVRRDAKNRLLIGTMGRVIGSRDKGLTRRWAEKRVSAIFPELGQVIFEDAWHGQIAMTPDHLPRVHQLAPGLWTAIGYNGRGITTGTLFGIAMADLLTGMKPVDLPLPMTEMSETPRAAMTSRFYDLAFTANQFWKSLR
ncbi:MAG: FAD-binding oxidoreductase [Paracoccaceae bacterium]|nr:FAD-binding oxidoreductase [Paracoccaceae bacterium]